MAQAEQLNIEWGVCPRVCLFGCLSVSLFGSLSVCVCVFCLSVCELCCVLRDRNWDGGAGVIGFVGFGIWV